MAENRIITEPDEDFDILGDLDANPLAPKEIPPTADSTQGAVEQDTLRDPTPETAIEATTAPAPTGGHPGEETSTAPSPPSQPAADPLPALLTGKDSLAFRRILAKAMEADRTELVLDFSPVMDLDGDAIAALARLEQTGMAVRVRHANQDVRDIIHRLLPDNRLFQ